MHMTVYIYIYIYLHGQSFFVNKTRGVGGDAAQEARAIQGTQTILRSTMKGSETMRKDSAVGILRRRRSFPSSSARLFPNASVISLRSGRSRGFRMFFWNDRNYSTKPFSFAVVTTAGDFSALDAAVRAKAKLSANSDVICVAARLGSCRYLEQIAMKAVAKRPRTIARRATTQHKFVASSKVFIGLARP